MPRLPTIRVMGSQFISTRLRFFCGTSDKVSGYVAIAIFLSLVCRWAIASGEFGPAVPPSRLFVQGGVGEAAHGPNKVAIGANDICRELCSGRLVHERHELIRKPRHGAANADAAHIRAAANAAHPAALGDITIDDRTPTTEFD